MDIKNYKRLIKLDETPADIIAELCDDIGVGLNEPFAFSAIMTKSKADDGYYNLTINVLEPVDDNPYTVPDLIHNLFLSEPTKTGMRYCQPPLEQWLELFKPLLQRLVSEVQSTYEKLIPDREDLLSILYLTVVKLHRQGYYLHKHLIKRSYINALNMECRVLKGLQITDSLDVPIGHDDEGKEITLLDTLCDKVSTEWAEDNTTYTDKDYWSDMYERIRTVMVQDMGEFKFNRIMIQLKSKTVDRSTAYILDKYRNLFNPGYTPRPTAKGKSKTRRK